MCIRDSQGRGDVQQAPADVHDRVAVDGDVAQVEGGRQVLRGDLALEVVGQGLRGEPDRGLLRPADAEQLAELADVAAVLEGGGQDVAAVLEGGGQLGDAAEGVTAFQQGGDGAQPGQVVVVVPGDPPLAAGRWEQFALAVEAQGADRDAGRLGQFLRAVLAHRLRLRLVLRHSRTLWRTGSNFPGPTPTHEYGPALLSRLCQ